MPASAGTGSEKLERKYIMEFVHNSRVPVRHTLLFEDKEINEFVGRVTSFTFVFWVQDDHEDIESSKIHWRNYLFTFLSNLRIPSAVSPLHDQDVNEVDEYGQVEFKDPHFHVVIDFGSGNNKTIKQIFDLIRPIRDYISIAPFDRYFTDDVLDDLLNSFDVSSSIYLPEDSMIVKCKKVWLSCNAVRNMRSLLRYFKHLDNPEKFQYKDSITSFGGFEVEDRIYSQTDSLFILDDIFDWIELNECYSYWNLLKYCRKNNREWYSVIAKNTYSNTILNALKSFAVENTGYLDKKIDKYQKE